jgi:methylthioribose-1-phosphate isomerase
MEYLDLTTIKKHIGMAESYTDDDTYIEALADASEEKVASELHVSVSDLATIGGGTTIPSPLKVAMLLNVGLYYQNREEVTVAETRPLEQGSKYLISLYRDYSK